MPYAFRTSRLIAAITNAYFAILLALLLITFSAPPLLAQNETEELSGSIVERPTRLDDRPNVIVILTDDQGWGDLSLHGNKNLQTPNLDRLALTGARFSRFYVCPVCAPTRAEFLTGRYHLRGGVLGVSQGKERLDTDETTIADFFQKAGYKTAAFGKWHNGMQYPYHPLARGFQEFYGYCSGHWGDYFSPQLEHNGRLVQGDGYLVDDFTNHAIEFIEKNQREPFFLYLPMPTPHAPMQVPDEYWDRFQEKPLENLAKEGDREDKDFTRAALAMVECIDSNVGRLLAKLDETGLSKDTIVIFFCDNGPNSYRWNGEMKGKKGSTDEGGVRSPLFVSWPGKIRAGRLVSQISGAIDLLPTLSQLCNVPLVRSQPLDGVSLVPVLLGTSGSLPNRTIFSHWNKKISVRTQQFRLDHQGQLFNMNLDPGQTQDVSQQYPDVRSELDALAKDWMNEMTQENDGSWEDSRPFVVGHPDFPWTQLPARDAVARGDIVRSGKAPNCSYYTNWSSAKDTITWQVEVLESGNFEVDLYYACTPESRDTKIEMNYGDQQTVGQIEVIHNPPAVGAEHDRVTRTTQSFVKDFKPLRLGKIHLEAGQGEIELRARNFKPDAMLEMRLLMLKRVL